MSYRPTLMFVSHRNSIVRIIYIRYLCLYVIYIYILLDTHYRIIILMMCLNKYLNNNNNIYARVTHAVSVSHSQATGSNIRIRIYTVYNVCTLITLRLRLRRCFIFEHHLLHHYYIPYICVIYIYCNTFTSIIYIIFNPLIHFIKWVLKYYLEVILYNCV